MVDNKKEVSEIDKKYFTLLRANVESFMKTSGKNYDREGLLMLDIAPQDYAGANPFFPKSTVETLDISPDAGTTYVADLCVNNGSLIPNNRFDIVVCTEVLEHTLQPFNAVNEIERILKPGGIALISTPYNFRIHGPLPDCWRFTEHGLRALFSNFDISAINALEDEDRFLAPIHYTMVAKKR